MARKKAIPAEKCNSSSYMQQTFLQGGFGQRTFDYTRDKCKQLCSECGKFHYTLSAKHAAVAYEVLCLILC
jgi:hypothetical protein